MATWTDMTTADVLAAWDRGEPVWSCEMGGIGPGYEQCIQEMGFAMLRAMHEAPPENWKEMKGDAWRAYADKIDADPRVKAIVSENGCSGAQHGAAMNIAGVFARHGYSKGMEMVPDDRRILVDNPAATPKRSEPASVSGSI